MDLHPDLVTASGVPVFYAHPWRTPVCPHDLRVHLSTSRRYLGAIDVPIALHLALCVRIARAWDLPPSMVALAGAHDAHEAYLPDLPTKLKAHLPDWQKLEYGWERWVLACLHVPPAESADRHRLLKLVDRAALWAEMHHAQHPGCALIEIDGTLADLGRHFGDGWQRGVTQARESVGDAASWWSDLCEAIPLLRDEHAHLVPPLRPGVRL